MPVSFTSMAQVPNNRLRARDKTDTVGGNSSAVLLADTLLKDKKKSPFYATVQKFGSDFFLFF